MSDKWTIQIEEPAYVMLSSDYSKLCAVVKLA